MPDTPDYSQLATPTAHHESHEHEAPDEISLAGLPGEPAELATHAALPTVHQDAPALIAAHAALPSIHHLRYTDTEAEVAAAALIAIHAAVPTAHQDAPALILDHKADIDAHHPVFTQLEDNAGVTITPQAGVIQFTDDGKANVDDLMPGVLLVSIDEDEFTHAHSHADLSDITPNDHHAEYTDADARALFSPLNVPAGAFMPRYDTHDWSNTGNILQHRTILTQQDFFAPVSLPDGVTVTTVTLHGYRDHAAAGLRLYLYRAPNAGGAAEMARVYADWTGGAGSKSDTSINYETIDNVNYFYELQIRFIPAVSVNNVKLYVVKISFTG